MAKAKAEKPKSDSSVFSVRMKNDLRESSRKRAELEDGVTLNFVINELLEGYSRGLIHMPRVSKTYQDSPN